MRDAPIIVVSGLPRSGTSLMMQMLAEGGVPVLTDGVRVPDSSNPRGYFEYEPVKKLAQDASWLPQARGKAVKIIVHLLPAIPAGIPLKILLMDRPMDEVVSSQFTMLASMGTPPTAPRDVLVKTFTKQREAALAAIERRTGVELLPVSFHRLVSGDQELVDEVIRFLGVGNLDRARMLAAIEPTLYRSRAQARQDEARIRSRLPWQGGKYEGLIVISVPKSGTNFLSRYLSVLTGWPHRWGRPSRDAVALLRELPVEPDPDVAKAATHLIQTESDIALLPVDQRPKLFGNRSLMSLEAPETETGDDAGSRPSPRHQVIAEHPVRSLPWFLRNPRQCPILAPSEVVQEAASLGYGVLFLYRDLRDIVNSLAHFLYAGTRFVKFRSLADAMDVTVHLYAPVLANAIRTWKRDFTGMIITYEDLMRQTRPVCQRIIDAFELPVTQSRLIESSDEFRTFTYRKGGSGDWRNHLLAEHVARLTADFPDLLSGAD